MAYISATLRQQLIAADGDKCAYCKTSVANSGQRLTVDHIYPSSLGGATVFENLCFGCQQCNEFKGVAITGTDPLTGETVSLFHPRTQLWHDHFTWDASAAHIVGLTATGRATVIALKMNNELIVRARRRWVSVGWHPPD